MRGKNSPKWGSKPLQWSQVRSRLSDMLNRSTLLCSSPPYPLILSAINLLPVMLKKRKNKENFLPTEKSLFALLALKSTTGEQHIWVPVPDDVRTGADPKPAAQRVPQRGRLRVVFPSCASMTSSCHGEPLGAIWRGLGLGRGGLSTANSN